MSKKIILVLMLAIGSGLAFADDPFDRLKVQTQKNEKRVDGLEKNVKQAQDAAVMLKKQAIELLSNDKSQQQRIAELSTKLNELESKQTALGGSIERLNDETDEKTHAIDQTITAMSKWYGVAIAVLVLFLGGIYWYLRRRNDASEQALSTQVNSVIDTIRSTEEKIAKSDMALADSLFEIINKLKVQEMSSSATGQTKSSEPDHHLPIKLADEIHRMRKRLVSLPDDTKGLTPLKKSLERLEAELSDQGYEIIDHTGMRYTENLSVKARFVPSDDLVSDQKIISKVVIPQVDYKGVMIRMADIEVSI
jgi:hypothetical protein